MVKLLCINPAVNLKECLDRGVSTLFLSYPATHPVL